MVRVVGHGVPRPGLDIDFLGALDDAERNHALATSDVYVAPQTGRESFGIVLLEAMASGAPVVASDLPAFREVVSDARGPIGDLFRTGDPDDLARALLASLERPRDELVERGRARAGQFDWEVLGPRIVQAYRDAIRHADDIGPRQPGIITAAARHVMAAGQPRRTIRLLWAGAEEVGGFGSKAYFDAYGKERHAVALESDFGADRVWRVDFKLPDSAKPLTGRIAAALAPLGITPGKISR